MTIGERDQRGTSGGPAGTLEIGPFLGPKVTDVFIEYYS